MTHWISFPKVVGNASRQAHADIPAGSYERELGREGFFGPSTQMVHKHPPTGWSHVDGPCRPRAFDTTRLSKQDNNPWNAVKLLGNSALALRFWQIDGAMDQLARNSDGDELLFVHQGSGHLFCDYGHLVYKQGDYLLIPRGTLWRLETTEASSLLLIEASNTSYGLPDKGMVGHHAIFDPAILDTPELDEAFRAQQDEKEWQLVVKRRGELSTITYPYNPLDMIGWHGNLCVVRLNWRDIRPLMSHRYHLPPSAHTTFMSDRFMVSTFCPRPLESDPGALRVPFFHNNDDYDEVIFYHSGEFFSRDNIQPGMLTFHPSGITHGPHPKAFETGKQQLRQETNEVAVMIDARDPLEVTNIAEAVEWSGYVDSWQSTGEEGEDK